MDVIVAGQLLSIFCLLGKAEKDKQRDFADEVLDCLCSNLRKPGQGLCSLRCWFGHIRDQVHHCGLCYERVPRLLDAVDQVNLLATSNCIRPLGGKRRSECTLRGMYR